MIDKNGQNCVSIRNVTHFKLFLLKFIDYFFKFSWQWTSIDVLEKLFFFTAIFTNLFKFLIFSRETARKIELSFTCIRKTRRFLLAEAILKNLSETISLYIIIRSVISLFFNENIS